MIFVVAANGRFGIPLGNSDASMEMVEFKGKPPSSGTVVEALAIEPRRTGGMPVVLRWQLSTEWVRWSGAIAPTSNSDPSKPVARLADAKTLDAEANQHLTPFMQKAGEGLWVKATHIAEFISHYEFLTIEAERNWLAKCVQEGRSAAVYKGKPLCYRPEVAQPLIETLGENHIRQALKEEVETAKADYRIYVERAFAAKEELVRLSAQAESARANIEKANLEANERVAYLDKLEQDATTLEQQNAELAKGIDRAERRLQDLGLRVKKLEEEEKEAHSRIRAKNKALESEHKGLLKKVEDAKRRARIEHDHEDARVPALRELSELVDEQLTLEQLSAHLAGRIDFVDLVGFHVAMKLFPFVVLTGPSGSGKSSLLHLYGEALGFYTELIPVQPNWTSVADLHGYVFPLGGKRHYVTTPFSRALGMQVEEEEFLSLAILDEINLAHVEYYLADYLSAFERERIVDLASRHELEDALAPQWISFARGRVRVPETFLMAGTANEDHTTRAFSDKFRDRMAALEIPARRFEFGKPQERLQEGTLMPIGRVAPATWMHWRSLPTQRGYKKTGKAFEVANNILDVLRTAGLEFGQRQLRDVEDFVFAAEPLLAAGGDKVGRPEDRAKRACDIALEMRLLQKSGPLIEALREHGVSRYQELIDRIEKALAPQKKHFPRSIRWVEKMKARA